MTLSIWTLTTLGKQMKGKQKRTKKGGNYCFGISNEAHQQIKSSLKVEIFAEWPTSPTKDDNSFLKFNTSTDMSCIDLYKESASALCFHLSLNSVASPNSSVTNSKCKVSKLY